MVEKVKKPYNAFTLEGSDLVEENDKVLNEDATPDSSSSAASPAVSPAASSAASSASQPEQSPQQEQSDQLAQRIAPVVNVKPAKTTKTVKLILPIEYYFSLSRIKECTNKSLQDLAAQAVMDFVDNFGKKQVNEKSDV